MALMTLKNRLLWGGGSGAQGDAFFGIFEGNNMGARNVLSKGQLPLHLDDFITEDGNPLPCEQGMMLVYDEARGVVRRPRHLNEKIMIHYSEYKMYDPTWTLKNFALWPQRGERIQIQEATVNAWGEMVLDADGNPTMNDRYIDQFTDTTPFPRLYPAMPGDVFTTNTVILDTAVAAFGDDAALAEAIASGGVWAAPYIFTTTPPNPVTGEPAATAGNKAWGGYLQLTTDRASLSDARNIFQAVKFYDLPDGQPAIRFEVW